MLCKCNSGTTKTLGLICKNPMEIQVLAVHYYISITLKCRLLSLIITLPRQGFAQKPLATLYFLLFKNHWIEWKVYSSWWTIKAWGGVKKKTMKGMELVVCIDMLPFFVGKPGKI